MATQAPLDAKLDIGRVIQRGFEAIGRRVGMFVALSLLLVGLPNVLVQWLHIDNNQALNLSAFLSPLYWLAVLVSMLSGFLLQAAVVRVTIRDLRGESVDLADNLVEALKLLLPMVGLMILISLVAGLGLVFLIVPGIILYIMFILAVPVLVQERRGVIGSMVRSAELTRGSRWRIFLLLLLFLVAYMVVGGVIGAIAGVSLVSLDVASVQGSSLLLAAVQAIMSAIVGLLAAVMIASLYVELRIVREGTTMTGLAEIFA